MAILRLNRPETSPYYPPRAGRFGSPFRWLDRLFWRFRLDPGPAWEVSTLHEVTAFFVPGFGFYLRGPIWLGKAALVTSAVLLAVFVVFLGLPVANWAWAVLLSLHASGVLHRHRLLAGKSLPYRIAASVLMTLGLLFCLYLPMRAWVERYVATPLFLRGHPVIVRGAWFQRPVRTGDWIAYDLAGNRVSVNGTFINSLTNSGLDIGQVIASPGDQVECAGATLRVNGRNVPSIPSLQTTRAFRVQPHTWLVRPNAEASMTHGADIGEAQASALLFNALVNEDRIVGQPFGNWFGRKPTLP